MEIVPNQSKWSEPISLLKINPKTSDIIMLFKQKLVQIV